MTLKELKIRDRFLYRRQIDPTPREGWLQEFSPSGNYAKIDGTDDQWHLASEIHVIETLPKPVRRLARLEEPPQQEQQKPTGNEPATTLTTDNADKNGSEPKPVNAQA